MSDREISVSAAIALAQTSCRPRGEEPDTPTAGCRFAGTLRPGDTFWFPGQCYGSAEDLHERMHHVTVVWGPRLDTTSDIFGRDLIRYWIWDPVTGNEGSKTFGGPHAQVRVTLNGPYWIAAPGTLDPAAEKALPHHPACECATCRPDLEACHHPDCQCTTCQPGKWAPAPAGQPAASS
jgi:hypothetical protein